MTRLSAASYRRSFWLLMAIYVALILFVWPYAKTAPGLLLRTLIALLPALPIVAVMVVMARRMLHSDELEQRIHMGALGVATPSSASRASWAASSLPPMSSRWVATS